MAGSIFMSAVKQNGATLLPIDSEHNAIFQCLPHNYSDVNQSSVKKLILSASGGPQRLIRLVFLPMIDLHHCNYEADIERSHCVHYQ